MDFCAVELVEAAATPVVGLFAVLVAWKQVRPAIQQFKVANRTRLEKQFVDGANLLDHREVAYSGRTAGAVTLADLALNHPDEYDERVMRVFQPFLDFPPRYGKNHRKEGQVDYTSHDTVAIVDAINRRRDRERRRYRISLGEGRPFRVNPDGSVEQNPEYDDPATRTATPTPTPPPASTPP